MHESTKEPLFKFIKEDEGKAKGNEKAEFTHSLSFSDPAF
jgi:hypothetical protein